MRLTPAQREVLLRLEEGDHLLEMVIPKKPFFRTLGKQIPATPVYRLSGNRSYRRGDRTLSQYQSKLVRYDTFRILFKRNLIQPDRYDPKDGQRNFNLTVAGTEALLDY